ncbi:MAG: SDR family oxidoreductase [Verrucomicrobiota bacterium]
MSEPVSPEDWLAALRVLHAALDETAAPLPDRAELERLACRLAKAARKKRRSSPPSSEEAEERGLQSTEARAQAAAHDRALLAGTAMQRTHLTGTGIPGKGGQLRGPSRGCHICGADFREIDALYHRLCPPCAAENRRRREQSADLSGRVALVTGGRIKIGRATALRLLRLGARVLVTTRFPHDAAQRFAEEPDFEVWRGRLEIHGLDFLDPRSVLAFAAGLEKTLPCLDILINNAAQTVKRPDSFYAPALARQLQPLPPAAAALLGGGGVERTSTGTGELAESETVPATATAPWESVTLTAWPGVLDRHGLPPDPRDHNSWTLRAHEVPPGELLEVLLVNAAAPAFLVSALKPLLLRSPHPDRFIVNATGTDGRFGVPSKPSAHPHINMGKAALNMLTCTAAADYAADRIHMNSVDTGWVSDESGHATREARAAAGWTPPLDMADAAARLCAPVLDGITGEPYSGLLLRHYHPASW